jgi:hypothetical protein
MALVPVQPPLKVGRSYVAVPVKVLERGVPTCSSKAVAVVPGI